MCMWGCWNSERSRERGEARLHVHFSRRNRVDVGAVGRCSGGYLIGERESAVDKRRSGERGFMQNLRWHHCCKSKRGRRIGGSGCECGVVGCSVVEWLVSESGLGRSEVTLERVEWGFPVGLQVCIDGVHVLLDKG